MSLTKQLFSRMWTHVLTKFDEMVGTAPVPEQIAAIGLPTPTTADAGKFLRVNSQGKYELVAIANAEEATF